MKRKVAYSQVERVLYEFTSYEVKEALANYVKDKYPRDVPKKDHAFCEVEYWTDDDEAVRVELVLQFSEKVDAEGKPCS